jgi:L-iditol 2-dehydrogenase
MRLEAGETVLVIGQGPIGIMLSLLAKRAGVRVIISDLFPQRLTISKGFGLTLSIDGSTADLLGRVRELTEGRGTDAVILAVGRDELIKKAMDCARPGGKVMLFAQTQHGDATIDPAAICMDEKTLMGSYSASVDLQDEVARFVLSGELNLEALYSHRFPLSEAIAALRLAASPQPATMKIAIQPGRTWQGMAH